jgi:hypothetical protein
MLKKKFCQKNPKTFNKFFGGFTCRIGCVEDGLDLKGEA